MKTLACMLLLVPVLAFGEELDPKLPDYEKPKEELKGTLHSKGSDTLNNMMTWWDEAFKKLHPEMQVLALDKGGSTAPPALIAGTAHLGPMSRLMKENEIADFKKKFGYEPTCIRVCVDTLAVFVHNDNPIKGLTLTQLDAVYSSTRKRGAAEDITSWSQLGLKDDWGKQPIKMFTRNRASGTYGFFRARVLAMGDFKEAVEELPGSGKVIKAVSEEKLAVGFTGIGYLAEGVRAVPLSEKEGEDFVEPTYENALSGRYPLSRFLYIYFNKSPGKPLAPELRAFLQFVLSKQGQEIVIKDGCFPLTKAVVEDERKKLE